MHADISFHDLFIQMINANLNVLHCIQPIGSPDDKLESPSKESDKAKNELSSSPDERGITTLKLNLMIYMQEMASDRV